MTNKNEKIQINKDDLLKIKSFLESISDLKYIAKDQINKDHNEIYKIVYNIINPDHKLPKNYFN